MTASVVEKTTPGGRLHGKRLIPVLRRKDYAQGAMHPRLGQHQ